MASTRTRSAAERRPSTRGGAATPAPPRWLESVPEPAPPAPATPEPACAQGEVAAQPPPATRSKPSATPVRAVRRRRAVFAVVCREDADSPVALRAAREAAALAAREREVHLYCRVPIAVCEPRVRVHVVGASGDDLVAQAVDFGHRVAAAVRAQRNGGEASLVLVGHEWGALPALLELGAEPGVETMFSLHSLERQRSDLGSALAQRIHELEIRGLEAARAVLVHDAGTAEQIGKLAPAAAERVVQARPVFPAEEYRSSLDPGAVKARYMVGPVDPTILFVGDLDERHGPDLLIRAMPPILKNHPQARLIIVGDGTLAWPLRVMSRYMLLDHAIRIPGHVGGGEVRELIAAADVVVVPSRVRTEDWQILSGWAAGRPVVATYQVAEGLCRHEQDSVLIYANPASCVWGIERVFYDPELGRRIGERGQLEVVERFGWDPVATQLESLVEAG